MHFFFSFFFFALSASFSFSPLLLLTLLLGTAVLLLPSLFPFWFLHWRHHQRKRLPLPPGSMGWPYVGETLKLYTQNPNSFFSNRQKRYSDNVWTLLPLLRFFSFSFSVSCYYFLHRDYWYTETQEGNCKFQRFSFFLLLLEKYLYLIFDCLLNRRHGDVFKTRILGCPCVMVSSPAAVKVVLVTRAHLFKPTYPSSKERMIGPEAIFFHRGAYHARLKKLIQASFLPSAIRGSVSVIEQIVLKFLPTWNHSIVNTLQEMKKV